MTETSTILAEETLLRVRELEVKFNSFETENKMSDSYFNQLDDEVEEGRVNLEKLEKRVTQLESEIHELIAGRLASLKTENSELREHLNVTIDTLNNVVEIINDQVIARELADGGNPDIDDGVDRHHYLNEVYTDHESSSPHPEPY